MSLDKITFDDRTEVEIKSSTQKSARLNGDSRWSLLKGQRQATVLAKELEDGSAIDFAGYYKQWVNGICRPADGFPKKIKASGLTLEYSPLGDEGPIKKGPVPNSKKSKEAKRVGGFTCESLERPSWYQKGKGRKSICAETHKPCPVVTQVAVDRLIKAAIE